MKTLEHNATTGKIVERELTEQEIAQIEIDTINSAARQAEAEAKAAEKAALLDRLGITADEAKLLLA
jgi:FMN-dependent NADH-azoreductase